MRDSLMRNLFIVGFFIWIFPDILDVNIIEILKHNFKDNWFLYIAVIGYLFSKPKNKHKSRS